MTVYKKSVAAIRPIGTKMATSLIPMIILVCIWIIYILIEPLDQPFAGVDPGGTLRQRC